MKDYTYFYLVIFNAHIFIKKDKFLLYLVSLIAHFLGSTYSSLSTILMTSFI